MSDLQKGARQRGERGAAEIDRRFLDENAEGQQEIIDSAVRASETDRQDTGSPEKVERSHGVKDPSHSRGSTRRKS